MTLRRREALLLAAALPLAARAAPERGELPDWPAQLALADGGTLERAALLARPLIAVWWSLSCAYCERHNPRVAALWARLQRLPQQAVPRVLGFPVDGTPAQWLAHQRERGWAFPQVQDAAALRQRLGLRRVLPLTLQARAGGALQMLIPGEMADEDVQALWPAA